MSRRRVWLDAVIVIAESAFAIRRMTKADLQLALGWAAAEGWNPSLHDANCFYAAAPP